MRRGSVMISMTAMGGIQRVNWEKYTGKRRDCVTRRFKVSVKKHLRLPARRGGVRALFHDFTDARSPPLAFSIARKAVAWLAQDGRVRTRALWRNVRGRSQIATMTNCNFLARVIRGGVVRAQLDDRLSRAFLAR